MKRLVVLTCLVLGAAALFGMWGCSDSGDDNPINSGNPDDPTYALFQSHFEDIDEITNQMVMAMFMFVDSIEVGGAIGKVFADDQPITLEYHDASGYWLCTYSEVIDDGTLHLTDSIQFRHGALAVQWPDDDSLTQVTCQARLTRTGDSIDTAYVTHAITLTLHPDDPDLIVLNGTGRYVGDMVDEDDSCEVDFDINLAVSNLVLDPEWVFGDGGDDGCPVSGSLAYSGTVNLASSQGTVSGTWTVAQTFNNGTMTVTVTGNGKQWQVTEDCSVGSDSLIQGDSVTMGAFANGYEMVEMVSLMGLRYNYFMLDSIMNMTPSKIHPQGSAQGYLPDTMVLEYHASSGYWYFFWLDSSDSYYQTGVDSIKFFHGDVAVSRPDSGLLTSMIAGGHASITEGDYLELTASQLFTVEGDIIGNGQLTLNGTQSMEIWQGPEDSSVECGYQFDLTGTITDMVVEVESGELRGCPLSGTLAHTGEITLACDWAQGGFNLNDDWSVVEAFYGDSTVIDAENSDNYWRYSYECSLVPKAPWWMGTSGEHPRFPWIGSDR